MIILQGELDKSVLVADAITRACPDDVAESDLACWRKKSNGVHGYERRNPLCVGLALRNCIKRTSW